MKLWYEYPELENQRACEAGEVVSKVFYLANQRACEAGEVVSKGWGCHNEIMV